MVFAIKLLSIVVKITAPIGKRLNMDNSYPTSSLDMEDETNVAGAPTRVHCPPRITAYITGNVIVFTLILISFCEMLIHVIIASEETT